MVGRMLITIGHQPGGAGTVGELLENGQPPLAAEHLITVNAEDGTHSIIDMWYGIGEVIGYVAPLPFVEYDRLFGTQTPPMPEIEAQRDQLVDLRGRWEDAYLVAYVDGSPDKLIVTRFSGD